MTEPTRDALHAATLGTLAEVVDWWGRDPMAAQYAYAAECVKRVPELEAEVERLRAKAAIVDAMPNVKAYKRVTTITRVERVTEEG